MKRQRLLTAAAGTLVAAAIAGVAWAAIPGPGNVYTACMLKGIGTMRLIDKSLPATNLMSRCTDKEIEISWNQAGQAGAAGPPGAQGEPGPSGNDGLNGTNGADGKDGVSVTAASEPAGVNCADGGVELTVANGIRYVCNGRAGVDGRDGTNGTNGADGKDGVSVTSAVEPAGTNCASGGSKFTAANGVTYVCNGAPGSGGGPIGQDATSVYGTATLSVTPTSSATLVPGLTQTISVPADSVVYIATDGAVLTNSSSTTAVSAADIFVTIDGQAAPQGLFRRILCPNTAGVVNVICGWSLSAAIPLSQGTHTVSVQAAAPFGASQGAATATVSGGGNSANQGALTLMVLRR